MPQTDFQINIGVSTQIEQLKAMEAQFAKQIVQLRTLGDTGSEQLKKVEANLGMVRAAMVNVGASSGGMGAAGTGAFQGIGRVAQAAGYQVQDFAVQVASGQSAITAFAQQGSQLAGVFGPTGAIVGAVISVGALVWKMLDMGSATDGATVKVSAHKEAILQLIKAQRELAQINDPSAAKTFAGQDVGSAQAKYDAQMLKVQALGAKMNAAGSKKSGTQRVQVSPGVYTDVVVGVSGGEKEALAKDYEKAVAEATKLNTTLIETKTVEGGINKELVAAREANIDLLRTDQQRLDHLISLQAAERKAGHENTVEYITRQGQIQQLSATLDAAHEKRLQQTEEEIAAEKKKQDALDAAAAKAALELSRRNAQAATATFIAEKDAELAKVEANDLMLTVDKDAERLRILGEQNGEIQRRIGQLQAERDITTDPSRVGQIDGEISSLRGKATKNDTAITAATPQTIGHGAQAGMVEYLNSIPSAAKRAQMAVMSVASAMQNGISGSLRGLIDGTMSWGAALANIGSSIINSILQSFTDMVAGWIMSHVIMKGVRSIFHMEDVAETAATETAKQGIVTGSQAIQTTATVTGAGVRTTANVAEATTTGSAWSWAAIMASIGQLGPIAGPAVFVGAIAAMVAIVASMSKHADGGLISGPGTGTSDSVPAWLSNGEYVMPAAMTAKYRPTLDAMRNGTFGNGSAGALQGGGLTLAGGGGGVTINNHFASGVTRAEVAALIPEIERRTLAAVTDRTRRNKV